MISWSTIFFSKVTIVLICWTVFVKDFVYFILTCFRRYHNKISICINKPYIGVVGEFIVVKDKEFAEKLYFLQNDFGAKAPQNFRITDNLVRTSIGIKNFQDIIND